MSGGIIVALLAVGLLVGVLIGAIGIGGVLLVPVLVHIGGMAVHVAIATAMVAYFFAGTVGTIAFSRRGSIRWSDALRLTAGAIPGAFAGAAAAAAVPALALELLIALLIVASALHSLHGRTPAGGESRALAKGALFAIGAVTGIGSSMSGTGGPPRAHPHPALAPRTGARGGGAEPGDPAPDLRFRDGGQPRLRHDRLHGGRGGLGAADGRRMARRPHRPPGVEPRDETLRLGRAAGGRGGDARAARAARRGRGGRMRRRAGVADFPRMPGFLLDRIEPRPVMLRHSGSDPVPYFHLITYKAQLALRGRWKPGHRPCESPSSPVIPAKAGIQEPSYAHTTSVNLPVAT